MLAAKNSLARGNILERFWPVCRDVKGQTEEGWLRDAVDAVCPACQALPVQDYDADDLAEGQRHDGEVVASQAKHWKSKCNAQERRQQAGERETHPERPAELG